MELFTHISCSTLWHSISRRFFLEVMVCACIYSRSLVAYVRCDHAQTPAIRTAKLNINYTDRSVLKHSEMDGVYCDSCYVNTDVLKGQLVYVYRKTNQSHLGCGPLEDDFIPSGWPWVALIERGDCKINEKVNYAGKVANASAVVIYHHNQSVEGNNLKVIKTTDNVTDVLALFVDYKNGITLKNLIETYKVVNITICYSPITSTTSTPVNSGQLNNTSVLFVSISFIVLIIISLAWLIFYYVQRCRYTNAKERLSRRLTNAAKKAIAKIPQRPIRQGDKELESDADQCAVCIEPYKVLDVIRVLPCKHVFHKSCVDPWLLDQRNCPMCKMDILRAFGMHLNGSQESVPQDIDSGLVSSTSPAMDNTEHLSTSEEQGAVGAVKIVLYQHLVRYQDSGSGQFHKEDLSNDGSLDFISTPLAHCSMELNQETESSMSVGPSLAKTDSLEGMHIADKEFNEIDSLLECVPSHYQSSELISLQRDSPSICKNNKESVELLYSD